MGSHYHQINGPRGRFKVLGVAKGSKEYNLRLAKEFIEGSKPGKEGHVVYYTNHQDFSL